MAAVGTVESSPLLEALHESLGDRARGLVERGFPTQRAEEFRYVAMRRLRSGAFTLAGPADPGTPAPVAFPGLEDRRIVLAGGRLDRGFTTFSDLPSGVRLSVGEAELPDHVPAAGPGARRDFFKDLNELLARPVLHLEIGPGVRVEEPIHLALRSIGGREACAVQSGRVLVTLGEGASAKIVRSTEGTGNYLANYHVQFELAPGAKLVDHLVSGDPELSFSFDSTHVALEREASYALFALGFGSRIARNVYRVDLLGEGGWAELSGAEVVGGDREIHKHITVHHRAPACHSNQHFKTVLGQQANASYDGAILVDEVAQKTDAFQLGGNLMLSDEARAFVKPALYIHADDVKCSHGGTCGQLEEEELHYIQTRGIPRAEARRLMIAAFALEVLDRIEVESVRAECVRRLSERLVGLDEADTRGLSTRENRAKKR